MKKILILAGRYLPGHKDGGPLRTLINVTDALGDEYDFYIGCLDRDHGDTEPYPNILTNEWTQVGKAKVWYVSPGGFTNDLILKLAEGKDSIYLTSFFEDYGYKTLLLKRRGKIKIPIALASMGVFSKSALAQKHIKKSVFILFCKMFGLFRTVTWSVTSALEADDLKHAISDKVKYVIAEDLPRRDVPGISIEKHDKLHIVFLSRICAHKGLDIAVKALQSVDENKFVFTIYGPIQDEDYWNQCIQMLKKSKMFWEYRGDVASANVQEVLSHHDVLVLPTKSENYGHVIIEALSVGCIPIISNNTPWVDLESENAGFICSCDENAFASSIRQFFELTENDMNEIKNNAVKYAELKVRSSLQNSGYKTIFG